MAAIVSAAIVSGMVASPAPRMIDHASLTTHIAAAIGAGFEVVEDVESIGHGHGSECFPIPSL